MMVTNEIWKDIPRFKGLYQASNLGRIKSLRKNKVLAVHPDGRGYEGLFLSKKGKKYKGKVHRLVAQTFKRNPKKKPEVNHKDGVKTNNLASNLEWATRSENEKHKYKMGLSNLNKIHQQFKIKNNVAF